MRTPAGIGALDKRDHVAFIVGRGEVDGVRARGHPGLHAVGRPLGVDAFHPLRRVLLRDEPVDGHRRFCRVGVVDGTVLEGQLLRFDEQVQVFGGVRFQAGNVEVFEQIQGLERGDALTVRRNLPHVIATVARAHRVDPVRRMLREITHFEEAALLLRGTHNPLGDFALVKHAPAFARHQFERICKGGVAVHVAETQLAVRLECRGQGRKALRVNAETPGDDRRQREPFARIFNGRREQFAGGLPAEAPVQFLPAAHTARHRPRQGTVRGNRLHPQFSRLIETPPIGRASAGIEPE